MVLLCLRTVPFQVNDRNTCDYKYGQKPSGSGCFEAAFGDASLEDSKALAKLPKGVQVMAEPPITEADFPWGRQSEREEKGEVREI